MLALFPSVELSCYLRVDPEKKAQSAKGELLLIRHRGKSFHDASAAVCKDLFASKAVCGTL